MSGHTSHSDIKFTLPRSHPHVLSADVSVPAKDRPPAPEASDLDAKDLLAAPLLKDLPVKKDLTREMDLGERIWHADGVSENRESPDQHP